MRREKSTSETHAKRKGYSAKYFDFALGSLMSSVKTVDIAAAIDLRQRPRIDELRRTSLSITFVGFREMIDDRLNRAVHRIRFGRHLGSVNPGLFQSIAIVRADKFRQ